MITAFLPKKAFGKVEELGIENAKLLLGKAELLGNNSNDEDAIRDDDPRLEDCTMELLSGIEDEGSTEEEGRVEEEPT